MVEIASAVSADADGAIDRLLDLNQDPRWLLTADQGVLQAVSDDVGVALHLRRIGELLTLSLEGQLYDRPLFDDMPRLLEYLQLAIGGLREERLVVLYLDAKLRLIDVLTYDGTADAVTVHPRSVVLRALVTGAAGIVLAHNHPSGDPMPSRADIDVTRTFHHALKAIDVRLHDHIIIGHGAEYTSMRATGRL